MTRSFHRDGFWHHNDFHLSVVTFLRPHRCSFLALQRFNSNPTFCVWLPSGNQPISAPALLQFHDLFHSFTYSCYVSAVFIPSGFSLIALAGLCLTVIAASFLITQFIPTMSSNPSHSQFASDTTRPDHERFPELFRQGPMADRHKAIRVVPMRVMVFGLMRTGTSCKLSISLIFCSDMPCSGSSCSFSPGL
jgi:hypothetical protein